MPRLTAVFAAALGLLAGQASAKDWESPPYNYIFNFPLPIPPVKQPLLSITNETTGRIVDFYEVNITSFKAQTYPNLGPTTYVGYDAIGPGPTIKATVGREAVVRFVNKYDRPSSIHLHGSYSRAPFDGWAADEIDPGQYKDYYYPNGQAERTLWYHDHAEGITAVNAYFGQAGFYLLDNPATDFGLPTGNYDIPLMITSRQFKKDGSLVSPEGEDDALWGDVITVNGQPWPYFKVEPRKYRFRLLDASVSRTMDLFLTADAAPNTRIPFQVVASDAGYMSKPVSTTDIVLGIAERWEIVVDFSQFAGKNVTLRNERDFQTNVDYFATDRVVKFVVGNQVTDNSNNGAIPSALATLPLPEQHTKIDREFEFERKNGQWLINGVGFSDVKNRVLARPQRGNVERWRLVNKSGGWSHPIHVHLVDFQMVKREDGRGKITNYEAAALKDVAYLGTNEKVEILANFAPWPGVYMFHCHNLIHEDHDMMAAFNVTDVDLSAYGYEPERLDFIDPEAPEWSARTYQGTDLNQVRAEVIPRFLNSGAYPNVPKVEAALSSFWETATPTLQKRSEPTTFAEVRRSPEPEPCEEH